MSSGHLSSNCAPSPESSPDDVDGCQPLLGRCSPTLRLLESTEIEQRMEVTEKNSNFKINKRK